MSPPAQPVTKARQRVVKIRRDYNTWVATPDNFQTIGQKEDVFAVEAILYRAQSSENTPIWIQLSKIAGEWAV